MADWTKTPRFITEINLLRQNTRAVLWRREPYGPVGFDEAFLIEGVVFEIRVVFTGSFPYEAPRVFLLRPALPSFVEVHRFNDGSLCLHGPGEWTPLKTAAWIRTRALLWAHCIVEFSKTGVWPSGMPAARR